MFEAIKQFCLNVIIIWWAINMIIIFFILIILFNSLKKVNTIIDDVKFKYNMINELVMMPIRIIAKFFKE